MNSNKETVHVALASDQNYFVGLRAAVVSLVHSNKGLSFSIHIMDGGIEAESKRILERDLQEFGSLHCLKFHDFDGSVFEGCLKLHGSYLTYARLLLPDIISSDRVLYLDSDVLVCGSINELLEVDLSESYVGACPEASIKCLSEDSEVLGKGRNEVYFNAGVLWINLKLWREKNVQKRIIEALRDSPEQFTRHDQTAMNWLFEGAVNYLPEMYNLDSRCYRVHSDAVVIHYLAGNKPWEVTYHNHASWLWLRFARCFMYQRFEYLTELVKKPKFLRSIKNRYVASSYLIRFIQVQYIYLKGWLGGTEHKKLSEARLKTIKKNVRNFKENFIPGSFDLKQRFKELYLRDDEK